MFSLSAAVQLKYANDMIKRSWCDGDNVSYPDRRLYWNVIQSDKAHQTCRQHEVRLRLCVSSKLYRRYIKETSPTLTVAKGDHSLDCSLCT